MAYAVAATSSRPVKSSTTARTKAFNLIKEKSFFKGTFTLSSGKESPYYLDMKPTMFDPEGAMLLAELVFRALEPFNVEAIGGLEMGAVPIISTVALRSAMPDSSRPLPGFFVRKNVKDHGTKRLIEGSADISGKRVAILDDVTTTGESAMIAVQAARQSGATIGVVLSVVDREEGAKEFYERQGIPFAQLFTAGEFLRAA